MEATLSELLCPRCSVALHRAQAQDVVLHGCGRCGGLWLDNAGSTRVIEALRPDVLALAAAAGSGERSSVDTEATIACPVCRRSLARCPAIDPSVQVDICNEHGTWFDRNELQHVAALAAKKRGEQPPAAAASATPATEMGTLERLFSYDPGRVMEAHDAWVKFQETAGNLMALNYALRGWGEVLGLLLK